MFDAPLDWGKLLEKRMRLMMKPVGLASALGIVALTVLASVAARCVGDAQAGQKPSAAGQEMQIEEQPGHVPSAADEQLDPKFQRQFVFFRTTEAPGTIVIQTSERFLYVVQGNNRALRYGIGVGRDGFQWSGLLKIARKLEWPDWRPPPEMIERQPYLPRFMAGGKGNPLGARAMYLGATVYRIHGTNQPETIGSAVSSGCFRLVNPDVIDLYDRVQVGTKVIVRQAPPVS
jgi:lipoprotein-anchoring transpeptidase ErfK/SrfK